MNLLNLTANWCYVYRPIDRSLIRFKKTQLYLYILKRQNATVPKLFSKLCQTHASRVLFYFEDQKWTFAQVDEYSNRVANIFLENGYHAGQEVALFMENKPEYICIWLGLAKAGLVTALINTNQRYDQLIHSVTVVNCKALIFGSELIDGNWNCLLRYFLWPKFISFKTIFFWHLN